LTNILRYQQSIAAEFIAIKDRVRFFIGNNHWGEDGRFKEIILMNFLKKILPDNVGVGTGFVINKEKELTDQIDIIIFKKQDPKLFSEGDFVIVMPESVLGIIEVKSKVTSGVLCDNPNGRLSTLEKCHKNGQIIGRSDIFNGIFSFERDLSFHGGIRSNRLIEQLREHNGYINHICFDDNIFMRFWETGNSQENDNIKCFSFYDLSFQKIFNVDHDRNGLAFGYFISNLLEVVYRKLAPHVLNDQYFEFLYPIENTKETYRLPECEIKIIE
jgi:hypothetical protein